MWQSNMKDWSVAIDQFKEEKKMLGTNNEMIQKITELVNRVKDNLSNEFISKLL